MLYPANAAQKTGLDFILSQIQKYTITEMAAHTAGRLAMITKPEIIKKYLAQTSEYKRALTENMPLYMSEYYDLLPLSKGIKAEGSYVGIEELNAIRTTVKMAISAISFLTNNEVLPHLGELCGDIEAQPEIIEILKGVLDDNGELRTNASMLLQELTDKLAAAQRKIESVTERIFKHALEKKWTAGGGVTIRSGHMCVPVLAEHKRKIRGFVLDESATGQTYFIQPEEAVELDNVLREVEGERKKEIVRILTEVCAKLRPYIEDMVTYSRLLKQLDVIRAKALYAISINAVLPRINNEGVVNLINAENPLLKAQFAEQGKQVVPLNIKIDATDRVIVVSGPNAGGKSVCMKTVGLLQIMTQTGILIPADENSSMGVFNYICADIGDDQSLESDLSTYSAHLTKMKYFLKVAGPDTLILIDEFGTGTDPQFGGPMAEAVLEQLNNAGCRGVITTHYSNLKRMAAGTQGLLNASMLFDNKALVPLFILETGKPGSSYAFEIAQKIGLPKEVLAAAKEKVGKETTTLERMLIETEREQKEVIEERRRLRNEQNRLKQILERTQEQEQFLRENKNTMLREAKTEARNIIQGANKLVENAIAEIKAVGGEKEQTRTIRARLQQKNSELGHEKKQPPAKQTESFKAGDWVRLRDTQTVAQIQQINKDTATLAVGNLITVTKLNKLEKAQKNEVKRAAKLQGTTDVYDEESFKMELDLRGKRGDEAINNLERYMDRAVMMGMGSMRILHGKGDGILRKLVRDYLRRYPAVRTFTDEHLDRGGDGITLVEMK